jgi:thiamine biosynthesis lipoprotein
MLKFFCKFLFFIFIAESAFAGWHEQSTDKMGTRVRVEFWLEDEGDADVLMSAAMAEFDRIEAVMSTYIDSSEVSRINAQAINRPQSVSEELYALLDVALQLSEISNGAFDITFDSVGYLYDYRAGSYPDALEIAAKIDAVDYQKVQLDEARMTVRFLSPDMRINLGGIAKGFAVEQVTKILKDGGVEHALVSAGGDMHLLGDRHGERWVIGVRDPDDKEGLFTRLSLADEAVSTSGDYERFFMEDGVRYHHILDPVSGKPAQGVRSVTIVGADATLTDGLSTAVFVLGPEAGMQLVAEMDGYEALIILADGTWYYSGGLSSASDIP